MSDFAQENRELLQEFARRNQLKYLGLFGSHARGDASPASDVDLLVEFGEPVGLLRHADVQLQLEELLNKKIDLVTKNSLNKYLKPSVLEDLVPLYEAS